jgi:carbamoylphosphate synthase large subunit
MTVKELIELLQKENPDALVYTMDNTDDIALAVTMVSKNILVGKDDTVVIH